MKILAIETSCDDTSIAIFEDDKLLAIETQSQIAIHNETGGVVPEVAAREHANVIFDVLKNVLEQTNFQLKDIDYIGTTTFPGLLPSLLTGTTVASTISFMLNIPIIPINHIEAHIFSNFLERNENDIKFPLVCLTVSGGHNDIYFMKDMWAMEKLGNSIDDAAGEAFDKSAKMMGLGYPGGPIISKLAEEYKSKDKKLFPRVWLKKNKFDFSFSGLKTSIKTEIEKREKKNISYHSGACLENQLKNQQSFLTLEDKRELSFEIENAITEVLTGKLVNAAKENKVKVVMLAGGVSANTKLKEEIQKLADKEKLEFIYPKKNIYSMDNAAMVGINTYYKVKYGKFEKQIGVVKM